MFSIRKSLVRMALALLLCAASGSSMARAGNPAPSSPSKSEDRISLQLKWFHSFQFAGYYAAVANGYYRESGLEVDLIDYPGTGYCPVSSVLSGSADYGIASSDLLEYRLRGSPVVLLAAIFQQTPDVLLVRKDSGIETLADLIGKRVMSNREDFSLFFDLLFAQGGFSNENVEFVQHTGSLNDFIEGRVDAMTAYISNQPYDLDRIGFPYQVFHPSDFGLDIYNDCLFTIEDEIRSNPDRVAAFREASLRGWAYAFDHPEETIDLIIEEYNPSFPREKLEFQARVMRELAQIDLVQVGYMNTARWQCLTEKMVDIGRISTRQAAEVPWDRFLFDPGRQPGLSRFFRWLLFGMLLSSLLFLAALVSNIYLRRNAKLVLEAKNLESEHNFRSMAQASQDGVTVVDLQGKILFANQRFSNMTGMADRSLEQHAIQEFFDEIDACSFLLLLQKLQQQDTAASQPEREMTLRPPSPCKILPVELTLAKIVWESQPVAMCEMRDISWRKRMQQDMLKTREMERNHLARELHDGVAQQVAAVAYMLEGPIEEKKTKEIRTVVHSTLQNIRVLANGLMPEQAQVGTIGKSIQKLADSAGLIYDVKFRLSGLNELCGLPNDTTAAHVYYIVQEAVMNAARHGKPNRIDISVVGDDSRLQEIVVADDGTGFDAKIEHPEGMGLRLMRHRAELIGADIAIESRPQIGTRVACRFSRIFSRPATNEDAQEDTHGYEPSRRTGGPR